MFGGSLVGESLQFECFLFGVNKSGGEVARGESKGATSRDYLGTTWAPYGELSDYLGTRFSRSHQTIRQEPTPWPITTF